jgi:hypothetical protein
LPFTHHHFSKARWRCLLLVAAQFICFEISLTFPEPPASAADPQSESLLTAECDGAKCHLCETLTRYFSEHLRKDQ